MSPRLHDPKCHGQLNSVELDGGEATLLSCSSCDYYSCTDDSLIEYPEQIGSKDQLREEDTTVTGGRSETYKDMSMDDLTYVWYPDIDSIPSPIIDDVKYLTIDTTAATQHVKSSSAVTQRNQSILTAGSGNATTVRANDISQRKTGKDLQRHSSHSVSAAAAPVSKVAQRSLSCAQINEMLELVLCPSCQSPKTLVVDGISLGDELSIRYCEDCGSCFGADDSMDLEDLERLFNDQKIVFKSKAIVCQCGNDDVERFVVSGVNQVTGQATIECVECHRPMELETSLNGDDEEFVEEEEEEDGWTSLNSYGYDNKTEEATLDSGLGFDFESLRQTSAQDPSSFHCDNCNHSDDGFFEKQLDINGRVTTVICLNCDGVQHIKPPMLCPVCRNSKDFETYYDSEGRLINAACRICLNSMDLKKSAQGGDDDIVMSSGSGSRWTKRRPVRRRRVFSIDDVRVGDHVTMHKEYVIWHHAIVVDVRSRARKLTVVHYTGGLRRFQGHHTGVREEELELDFEKDQVYVYDYGEDCDGPEKVVARARSRLGEHRYNPFTRNCEHFAYWCKLGEGQSNQVKAACRRVWKACGSAVGAGVREGVVAVCRGLAEGLPAKQVFGVGLKGGLGRVQGVAGGAGLVAGLKAGAVVFDVFLNLALEVGLFAYCAHKSRQKYKSGEITKDEFYREVCQTGCECAGGFIGATGGGFLGQLAIPVPFLGSLVGCTLGTLIGRFLGSIVGKKIADHFFNPKVAETVQPEPIISSGPNESHTDSTNMSRKLPCSRDSARNSDVLSSNFCQP